MIERLAAIDRSSCSKGEHVAADWIAAALTDRAAPAVVEREPVHGTYWWPLGSTSAMGIAAASAARRGRRLLGGALGLVAATAAIDDLEAGPRVLRRLLLKRPAANVVATTGDPAAARTLVLVAHHDAAHTSIFWDPRVAALLGSRAHRADEGSWLRPPPMGAIVAAPGLVAVGSLLGKRLLRAVGTTICAGIITSFSEIALRKTVPGANDNLTGVATLVGVAGALRERPLQGLKVILVSTGAEESLMEGMRAFARRHLASLPREQTDVLCVDTVGSPRLVLADAETSLRAHHYDARLSDLIAACAVRAGISLMRGLQMPFVTDGLPALKYGFRTALLTSVDENGTPSNYHAPTDTPDRVDYRRLADAVTLCEAVARELANRPPAGRPSEGRGAHSPRARAAGGLG